MKFKLKQNIFEAEQWFSGKEMEGVTQANKLPDGHPIFNTIESIPIPNDRFAWLVDQMNYRVLRESDFVVTNPDGTKRAFSAEVFNKLFEKAERENMEMKIKINLKYQN